LRLPYTRVATSPSSNPVCRAIISPSLVGITHAKKDPACGLLNVYAWDGNGNLTLVQGNVTTLPAGFQGTSGAYRDILSRSPDFPTGRAWLGSHARPYAAAFQFRSSGNFIHVGNQDSANIVAYKVDKTTGLLTPAGLYASSPAPSCIRFA